MDNCIILRDKSMGIKNLHTIYGGKSIQEFRQLRQKILESQEKEISIDSIEISSAAKKLSKVEQSPEFRKEKIKEIKRLLESQQLLTREKIRLAIKKMLILSI